MVSFYSPLTNIFFLFIWRSYFFAERAAFNNTRKIFRKHDYLRTESAINFWSPESVLVSSQGI